MLADFNIPHTFNDYLKYNGKFEGNLKGLLDEGKRLGYRILVKIGWDNGIGDVDNLSIETYSSFDYEDNNTLAHKVANLIVDNIKIRGIELKYYKENFIDENLINELKKLFNKK